eukprot:TRINITY_DN4153_c0_g1_i1.p1 TRINITY_DN4153_c0_g1~~TRINITY_DN4153_c0_g1_i1.p1  ORF type:complete len:473 (+),score=37.58 TRINITY_DN4153_c0_g1_i1:83-1501(+)
MTYLSPSLKRKHSELGELLYYEYETSTSSRSKVINDPVHGHVTFPDYIMDIVDTPQFQRLRDLKQLGCISYVFPGATHSRFEHSLGVSHLGRELIQRLKVQQPELEIENRDVKSVEIAALCHDLGHGPFSHSFEGWVRKVQPGWCHEQMSQKMLNFLIDDNYLDYSEDDRKFMSSLISGSRFNSHEKPFLFDIVANSRNSIDVDKFDYIARDCYYLGVKSSYDFSRLLNFNRVINGELCFHQKEVYNIYEMFHTRYSLHRQVYTHRVGKAVEYMISDALALADPYLKFSEQIDDPKEFCTLTDSILKTIEYSKAQELKPAKDIISNIRKRKLYKFADEVIVPPISWQNFSQITEKDIIEHKNSSSSLREADIILHKLQLNYAMENKNPVDNVHFFSKWDGTESFSIPREKVSLLVPTQFSEMHLRLFCRDPTMASEAQEAFRNFLKKRASGLTPSRALTLPPSPAKLNATPK